MTASMRFRYQFFDHHKNHRASSKCECIWKERIHVHYHGSAQNCGNWFYQSR